uniref:Contactin associated protein like 3 n=1 Tax=Myripristis murdjan TaxID=586833 RepID=A0A668A0U8_9TELE
MVKSNLLFFFVCFLSNSHGPGFAKLNRREGAGGWSPLTSDRYQWLEVDLGGRTQITAVATQGRYGSSDWLTAYLLMFSDTGHNWKQYRQEDSIGAFPGNSNADSVVQYKLQQPVIARFLRLIPLDWNPSGRIGLRLETYGCPYTSDVASFDGSGGGLLYRLSRGPRQTSREIISLKFKTLRNSGILLHVEGQGGLSLTLELERGKLLLLLRQGRSLTSETQRLVSLGSLLDDQHWHHVAVEQLSAHLNLTVDKNTQCMYCSYSVMFPIQLSVGTLHNLGSHKPVVSKRNFHGCLENLFYNGLNLIDLAKHNDHQATVMGNVTFSCAEPVSVAVTFTGPQSFLRLPGATASSSGGVSVELQFRTWNKAGLLLTFDLPQQGGVAWLYLSEARLRLQIHRAGSGLNDGQWHWVELNSRRARLTITVDKEEGGTAQASPSFPVTAGRHLFFGAVYEQSCEAYKHRGNTSGHYYIDVDGSGPIRPQLIYCNMTGDTHTHTHTLTLEVRPSPGGNQHSAHFDYSAEEEQLLAVISQSDHCEQDLSYHCGTTTHTICPFHLITIFAKTSYG